MSLINNPIFNSVLTGFIVYGTSLLTDNGYPSLGAILTTFPIGIMSMLTVTDNTLLDDFLKNLLVGNIIIVVTWFAIYYFSKNNDVDKLALIGLIVWVTLSLFYFIYLFLKGK